MWQRLYQPGAHNLCESIHCEQLCAACGTVTIFSKFNVRRLSPHLDVSSVTVRNVSSTSNIPTGGWEVDMPNASTTAGIFTQITTDLPQVSTGLAPAPAAGAGVRLSTGLVGASSIYVHACGGMVGKPPLIVVTPGQNYVLSGWIRTNGKGAVSMQAVFGRFDGSGESQAQLPIVMELPARTIGWFNGSTTQVAHPMWEPLLLPLTAPADGMRLALRWGATGGAVLDLYALALR